MRTLEEIKEAIASEYDPDLVVEVLEISTQELLDCFEEKLLEKLHKFEIEEFDEP